MKDAVSFETAIAQLPESAQTAATLLHEKAIAAGLMPYISKSGKKTNFYKIEYKRAKPEEALFVLRTDNQKWYVRMKLYHLAGYAGLLNGLSGPAFDDLVSSRPCKAGCDTPVEFAVDGKGYRLCRHGIRVNDVGVSDIPALWKLLEEESAHQT